MAEKFMVRSLRGTGESLGGVNMMTPIVTALQAIGATHQPIPYPASIAPAGGTKMFHESVADGRALARIANEDGIPSIWIGYSLGAYILGDLLDEGILDNCFGAILISDPKRAKGQVHPDCKVRNDLYGIAGARPIQMENVHSFSAHNDPISALPYNNGMRAIADIITGGSQPWQLGYVDVGQMLGALGRYLGRGPIGRIPAEPSRHVIYDTENMPGQSVTYIGKAAEEAVKIARSYGF